MPILNMDQVFAEFLGQEIAELVEKAGKEALEAREKAKELVEKAGKEALEAREKAKRRFL